MSSITQISPQDFVQFDFRILYVINVCHIASFFLAFWQLKYFFIKHSSSLLCNLHLMIFRKLIIWGTWNFPTISKNFESFLYSSMLKSQFSFLQMIFCFALLTLKLFPFWAHPNHDLRVNLTQTISRFMNRNILSCQVMNLKAIYI